MYFVIIEYFDSLSGNKGVIEVVLRANVPLILMDLTISVASWTKRFILLHLSVAEGVRCALATPGTIWPAQVAAAEEASGHQHSAMRLPLVGQLILWFVIHCPE